MAEENKKNTAAELKKGDSFKPIKAKRMDTRTCNGDPSKIIKEETTLTGPKTLFPLPKPTARTKIKTPPNWPTIPTAGGCTGQVEEIFNQQEAFEKSGHPAAVVVIATDEEMREIAAAGHKADFYVITHEDAMTAGLKVLGHEDGVPKEFAGQFLARRKIQIDENNQILLYAQPDLTKCGPESAAEAKKLINATEPKKESKADAKPADVNPASGSSIHSGRQSPDAFFAGGKPKAPPQSDVNATLTSDASAAPPV